MFLDLSHICFQKFRNNIIGMEVRHSPILLKTIKLMPSLKYKNIGRNMRATGIGKNSWTAVCPKYLTLRGQWHPMNKLQTIVQVHTIKRENKVNS